jgi:predicted SnoaL-like aldol condensation-catalyzing enzyme
MSKARRCGSMIAASASLMIGLGLVSVPVAAQEAVVPTPNADALFTSPDPQLNANKQVAYHIVRDLLEAGHWELADRYLTDRYLQHNPNAASGREGVIRYFVDLRKVKPTPIPETIKTPVVAVTAEGDLVTVVYPRVVKNEADPAKTYTTTWFDMWRLKDGKADEHWDPALKP